MQDRDITAQIWGMTYTQIWTKKRGLRRLNTLRGIMIVASQLSCFVGNNNNIINFVVLLFKVLKTRLCMSASNHGRLLHPASLYIST